MSPDVSTISIAETHCIFNSTVAINQLAGLLSNWRQKLLRKARQGALYHVDSEAPITGARVCQVRKICNFRFPKTNHRKVFAFGVTSCGRNGWVDP